MTDHGRTATSPRQMDAAAWKAIVIRAFQESSKDNIGLIAAGVAFYGFLAIVPVLGAIVLSYGLIATPETVVANIRALTRAMPEDAARLVGEQLLNVVQTSDGKKGLGLLLALALALFGARNAAGAIITALNVAYEEEEHRGFVWLNVLGLAMTVAGVVVALIAIVAMAALAKLAALFPDAPDALVVLGQIGTYALLTLAGAAGAAALYRFGPSRAQPRWAWLTPGSLLSALGWLALTLGFGVYVANFGNYNATYGSLGAVVVLLTWLYLSSYILLLGAELNAECEHQTAEDSTTGAARPMGERGAWVADHVAGAAVLDPVAKPVEPEVPRAAPSGVGGSYAASRVTSRVTSRVARMAGAPKVGITSSALATAGLVLVRRRAPLGLALLGGAAAIGWWRGAPEAATRASR